jgi:hypothetical protein
MVRLKHFGGGREMEGGIVTDNAAVTLSFICYLHFHCVNWREFAMLSI